ncbi:hypothetical protein [Bradyrhizobium elkanii]|uniref:hypothetical protein n=1 Tax=Bradyrhizobium elkanii TaxID=29448 RepID=UPI0021685C42|nr:hypothetical protein [Bradyrhizobium elkanii]
MRDPRTVARDIPGVLDILFPRLSGGLVASINRKTFRFQNLVAIPEDRVEASRLQKSMLFELAVVRAESLLADERDHNWERLIHIAVERQRRHFDARIPDRLSDDDIALADWAAQNLLAMLRSVRAQYPAHSLSCSPSIPGLGWISSGVGDFSLGPLLIEVKHTDRNFISGDFRQVLIYWLLKYAASLERDEDVWTDCLLLNPRRNSALFVNFDFLLLSASSGSNRIEVLELLRSILDRDFEKWQ